MRMRKTGGGRKEEATTVTYDICTYLKITTVARSVPAAAVYKCDGTNVNP